MFGIGTHMTEITEVNVTPRTGHIDGAPSSMSDLARQRVASTDDRIAFDALYNDYWPSLRRLATVLTGNAQDGQDLAQEAFARWYVHRQRVHNDEAYLRITLINLVRGGVRQRVRVDRFAHLFHLEAREAIKAEDTGNHLADIVAKLPIRQRAAVVLKYYEGRTEAEIAGILGCRPGTVKSLLSRALHELRRVVELEE
jgi:RNA polymerase sigma factor (sigma-70 family)